MTDHTDHSQRENAITMENQEWILSLNEVIRRSGPERVRGLLEILSRHLESHGIQQIYCAHTPYVNTIDLQDQPPYPGDLALEARIENIIRWNAMALVVRANRQEKGFGGDIATYASTATLYEVGFHHFFRGRTDQQPGDLVYFQGHASPGIYARAFLEGRLSFDRIDQFRHELHRQPGLSSYPHPWQMPDFWQFPTASMGLGPMMAIYHARYIKYLEDRDLLEKSGQKIWVFLGDGETDEPEALGAISLASRAKLNNLIFVINCNLQRLDGLVRGNGKIIQELETIFRGAGWQVIKVIWGSDWDPLLKQDHQGQLTRRLTDLLDGNYQKYRVEGGAYMRKHLFGHSPELSAMVDTFSNEDLSALKCGGHDPVKVYAAYHRAVAESELPTVILAQTVKGYDMSKSGEALTITHQQKILGERILRDYRDRLEIPLSDNALATLPFYRPNEDSQEIQYLQQRRRALGGYVPQRRRSCRAISTPPSESFREFYVGSDKRETSTTMAFIRLLGKLLKDKQIGRYLVPIVTDGAGTFGFEALFNQYGIYSHCGQLDEPVDKDNLLHDKGGRKGQILEEGITEAGALSSFIAAGTAYANHGLPTLPFLIFYSMGMQRVGDLIWAVADSRSRGFLIGASAGRTTLTGEGLQYQDGQSHLLTYPVPTLKAYDITYAYELATIIEDGIQRMLIDQEDCFYYLTVTNENYVQKPMPKWSKQGILKGMYPLKQIPVTLEKPHVTLLGSGTIVNEVEKAAALLLKTYHVNADIWVVTSYKSLYQDALACDRQVSLLSDTPVSRPYISQCLGNALGPVIAATDYLKALPASVANWIAQPMICLGTDGFGRSDGREALRAFFEVDAAHITYAALTGLMRQGTLKKDTVLKARTALGIVPEKPDPVKQAPDGSLFLSRPSHDIVKKLDRKNKIATGERCWCIPVAASIDSIAGTHPNSVCYLIGKGPSLDDITDEDFEDTTSPIICLNESVHKIETLHLSNPVYCIQQDVSLKDTCRPKKAVLLVGEHVYNFYPDYEPKYQYISGQLSITKITLCVIAAINIGKFLGCVEFILLAFDSCVSGNTDYAKCIGYDSSKGGNKSRFLTHKSSIIRQLGDYPYEFR